MVVKRQKDDREITIALDPQPDSDKAFTLREEGPLRLAVIRFTAQHLEVYEILGKRGLTAPETAEEQVLQALQSVAPLITVHSECGE